MEKIILIATCAASISAYALPTYEPFTEYAPKIASQGQTYYAVSNGVALTTAQAIGSVGNAIDLATNGLTAPGGETWTSLKFSGTATSGSAVPINGLDVYVVSNASIFTYSALTGLLPSTFPGFPAAGQAITNCVENPAQPLIYTNGAVPGYSAEPYIVGNSPVLTFASPITRPATGTKTLFVSYLFVDAQLGQTGAGNVGRYLAFLASTNLSEGAGVVGAYYTSWATMFNVFTNSVKPPGTATIFPHYFGHGVLEENGTTLYLGACDSSQGKCFSTSSFTTAFNTPKFIVGEVIITAGGTLMDTNIMWVNPANTSFGGTTPPASPIFMNTITNITGDVGGMVLIDRPGSGASGGVGTNYIANLMLGSTWSYVTGGPEFTTQPPTNTDVVSLANVTVTGVATAAGQSVSYQWQKVTASTTNNLTDTAGSAGGTATVSGSTTSTLTLSGASVADLGTYQVVATATGTGLTLTTGQSIMLQVTDPFINPQPQPVTVNEGGTASFSTSVVASNGPITYQWYNGTTPLTNGLQADNSTISGANGSVAGTSMSTTLMLSGVTYLERGNYILWVTNGSSASISSTPAGLTVNDPHFTAQPQSIFTTNVGIATNFTAAATGSGTISYQWYNQSGSVNNVGDISGAITTNLMFTNLQLSDAGTYYLVATGPGGSTSSSNFVITVLPIVTQPPNSVVATVGGTANIAVGIAGSDLTYQWYSVASGLLANTGDFVGVATSNLTIANAQSSDQGIYYVVVSWAGGSLSEQSSNSYFYVETSALGPFSPSNVPPTVAASSQVDYVILDANSGNDTPGFTIPAGWNNNLSLPASSGDQTYTTATTYNGLQGDTFTGTFVNPIDPNWRRFASDPVIDVLLQVYGNSDMYNATNGGLPTTWTEGQLNSPPDYVHQGTFPLGANNGQWNWMLLEVTNPVNTATGSRFVGDTTPNVQSSGGAAGGINNGTIRLEGWTSGLTIRTIALGPQGVFGTTNEINRFEVPASCAAEPAANLVYVDFNQGITNNLTVNNNGAVKETYQAVSGVGPAGDLRTAIQATSQFMEFPILDNALGLPCNENLSMQLCIEFYDDPALAGEQFGPYAYATDPYGDYGFVPGYPSTYNQAFYTLTGTGRWLKVDWFVGPANLAGLNTAPLTGGPLVYWGLAGTPPYIDRIELGVVRTGTNALAGQTPDPSYNIDPFICDTNNNTNGYYAEWDPTDGVLNNLTTGGGYATTVTGPSGDQRTAEVPNPTGGGAYYEQFQLQNNPFGPVLQDNADVAMIVTYYDAANLASNTLGVNTITTMLDGNLAILSPSGSNTSVTLQGTGKWVDAYFEVPNVNFAATTSFAAAPNFICRYASSAPIYISRVRYNVIRPCGQYEGIDYLQGNIGITQTNGGVTLNWRGTATMQASAVVTGVYPNVVTVTNTVTNTYTLPSTNNAEFFRLQFPSYPTNLSPYAPTP